MIRVAAILSIVCAVAAVSRNSTDADQKVLRRLSALLDRNQTIDYDTISALNKSISRDLIEKLNSHGYIDKLKAIFNETSPPAVKKTDAASYDVYDSPGKSNAGIVGIVEESPDYASSVVLASDILSLTSAVSNIKDKLCRDQGYKFLDGLLLNKRWALKMFDASSKSPQGLLLGSSYHMGNFDECVGIMDEADGIKIQGEYCLATIKWPQSEELRKKRTGRGETLRWAVCVPSACDPLDVQDFVTDVIYRTMGNTTKVIVTERDCYYKQPLSVSTKDIVYLSVIIFFAAILLVSTIYELIAMRTERSKNQSFVYDLIVSFSVISNMKKLLSTKQNTSLGLESISGIKTLSMTFILASHAILFLGTGPSMDAAGWDNLTKNPFNTLISNSMLLVDTFMILSSFLFCRLLLIELDKRRGRVNVLMILIFRYIRLTPSYLAVLWFYMTWFPKVSEGPLWKDRVMLEQERCEESWWANILYINNYVNTDKMCMFQSWYLSVDTQLFFIAPIFIYSLWRWRRVGLVLMGIATLIGLIVPAVITYQKELDPTLILYAKETTDIISNYYFNVAYIRTHMKMISNLIGLFIGYILHRIQTEKYELSRPIKIVGWFLSITIGTITVLSVCIFYQDWYTYDRIEAAAYNPLHRLAWGLCNGWIIISCATGNGGIIAKLLTWKFLIPFSRLTYSSYLVNGIIELSYVGQLRHPLHISVYTVTFAAVSHTVITFILGGAVCLIFESPIHGIEKVLLKLFATPALSDNAIKIQSQNNMSRNTSQSKLET